MGTESMAMKRSSSRSVIQASPVVAEGRIYILSDDAVTTVIAADRDFKKLGENPLHEHCQASMAVANGRFYIRTQAHLYCIATEH